MSEDLLELPQIDSKDFMPDDTSNKNGSNSRKNSESDSESENNSKSNLKLFQNQLKDKPEVLDFIIRQGKRIKKLEKKIKKLKSSLKKLKPKSKSKYKDASTQTPVDFNEEIKKEDCPKSITEEIKEAAENALLKTGFVYEPTSGMYYDYNTGYYYNAELGLYYDGNRGTYLVYNNETQTYDFHSQVSVPKTEETGAKRKKHHREQDGKRAKKEKPDQNLEEGECSDSDSSECSESDENIDISKSWPPCMRIILKETTIDKLKIGSLYIITCDGGNIGREGEKSIIIPDINVSKNHAEIIFNKELGHYVITDLGSQNGTILNGKRISAPKQTSEPQAIIHGSILQFGSTKLLCHIHDGQKTCGHCEPGLIQIERPPQIDKTAKKSTQHKKELRRLKKKFGLENTDLKTDVGDGYSDRAEERRKTVGSVNENEKTQVASVHESIASDNKGFKMLSKMGWSEGQALGKDGTGLTEPVPLVSNEGKSGLGSSSEVPATNINDKSSERKATVWKKAQLRFQKVKDVNLDAFKYESDCDT